MKSTFRNAILAVLLAAMTLPLQIASVAWAQTSTLQAVTLNTVRLRSGPGTQFEEIDTIPFDTTLTATGRNADVTWIQVNYNGKVGWAATSFLRSVGDPFNSLPIVTGTTPPGESPSVPQPAPLPPANPPVPPGAVTGTNYNAINVRSGPGTTYATLGMLPANSTVVLTGRWLAAGTVWVRFDFAGQEGWTASWLMTISGSLSSLPDVGAQAAAATAAIPQICGTGVGVPMAAAYIPGPGIHPVKLFDSKGLLSPFTKSFPATWQPPTSLATQLVACSGPQVSTVIETCRYQIVNSFVTFNILRYQYSINMRLIAAQSGQVLATSTLWGAPPRACQEYEYSTTSAIYGSSVSADQVIAWLRSWVEQ